MEKEFIPYEQALALKELGFDEFCFGHYQQEWDDDEINELEPSLHMIFSKQHQHAFQSCTAPTFSQSFRWFREKYGLSHTIHLKMSYNKRKIWYNINELDNRLIKSKFFKDYPRGFFKTYEEAELECLKKLIEIVK